KEQIRSIEEAAAILEGVSDEASASAAAPKLRKIIDQMQAQNARARKLAPIDADALQRVAENNHQASQAALERLNDAARKAAAVPECRDLVLQFNRDFGRLLR